MRYLLIVLILSFITVKASEIDSLKQLLKSNMADTTRVMILNDIGDMCDEDEILHYAKTARNICVKNYSPSLSQREKVVYLKSLALALNNIAYIRIMEHKLEDALKISLISLKIDSIVGSTSMGTTLNNIAYIYKTQGNIKQALDYNYKSLKLQDIRNNKVGVANSLLNIGVIYENIDEFENAESNYNKSLKTFNELAHEKGISYTHNNLGHLYQMQKQFIKALFHFNQSYQISKKNKDVAVSSNLNNIATVYREMKNYDSAIILLKQAIQFTLEDKDLDSRSLILSNLGDVYYFKKEYNKALPYALDSYTLAKQINNISNIENAASTLADIYDALNEPARAYPMYKIHIRLRDSIRTKAVKKDIIQRGFQYQYEKKAVIDSLAYTQQKQITDLKFKEEETKRKALYVGIIACVVFLVFIINRYRVTIKQKKIIEQQKKKVELQHEKIQEAFYLLHEKNTEIMDSIRYAARIQRSLITSEKYIAKILNK